MSDHCLANLKALRTIKGVSAQELADLIGTSLTSFYRFENGTRRLYLDRAHALARRLGCTVDDLARAPDDAGIVVPDLEGWSIDA